MKLHTRLLIAILVLALVPLLVLCALFYSSYRFDLVQNVHDHLDSVASIQQSRLSAILLQNEERLALVASRTQLRISLERFLRTGDPADQERMTRILQDAARSIADLENISVYSPDGMVVASTDSSRLGAPHFDPELFSLSLTRPVVDRLYLTPEGESRVLLCGPMSLEGMTLGALVIQSQVHNLLASLFDYAGLGQTGETILARPAAAGGFVFLAPTRFEPAAALRNYPMSGTGEDEALFAVRDETEARDYRNARVLAVARRVPRTDWVLAVKIDRAEAFRVLDRTAALALVLLGLLAAAIILLGVRQARSLSKPLVELAGATEAMAAGQFSSVLPVSSPDEIGTLVGNFNIMAREVAQAQAALQAKIEELNGEIRERARVEAERENLIAELRGAMTEIRSLKGIIPICASCKKIRDDQGYWNQLESYLKDHSDLEFTHGICPDCYKKFEEELDQEPGRD